MSAECFAASCGGSIMRSAASRPPSYRVRLLRLVQQGALSRKISNIFGWKLEPDGARVLTPLAIHRSRPPIMSVPAGVAHEFGVVRDGPSLVFFGASHTAGAQEGAA